MTYTDFRNNISTLTKLRLRNYTWTETELDAMISFTYNDITNEIRLEWAKQDIVIAKDVKTYDITLATSIGFYDAWDEDRYCVFPFLELDEDNNTIHIINENFLEYYDGKTLTLLRKHKPAVADADPMTFDKIQKAMVEGIVYFLQDSVPGQLDEQGANFHYQRYYNERKTLIALNKQMGSPEQTNTLEINFK